MNSVEALKIVVLCIVSAVVYGILHDLVTANLCVEYFSLFHPDVFHTTSPLLLALGWGVIATWWVGLFLGLLITAAARSGILPKMSWRRLVKPLLCVQVTSYVAALLAGLIGYFAYGRIPTWVLDRVPRVAEANLGADKQRLFAADLFAHNASYIFSALAALVLCGWIIRARMKMHRPMIAGQELF